MDSRRVSTESLWMLQSELDLRGVPATVTADNAVRAAARQLEHDRKQAPAVPVPLPELMDTYLSEAWWRALRGFLCEIDAVRLDPDTVDLAAPFRRRQGHDFSGGVNVPEPPPAEGPREQVSVAGLEQEGVGCISETGTIPSPRPLRRPDRIVELLTLLEAREQDYKNAIDALRLVPHPDRLLRDLRERRRGFAEAVFLVSRHLLERK